MKITLSIEESARLIELGVDAKLASDDKVTYDKNDKPYCHPIYSLTDLLSILPKEIDDNILVINAIGFNFETEELEDGWSAFYVDSKYHAAYGEKSIFFAPELIDSLYQLLIWCLEQGYCKCGKGGGK